MSMTYERWIQDVAELGFGLKLNALVVYDYEVSAEQELLNVRASVDDLELISPSGDLLTAFLEFTPEDEVIQKIVADALKDAEDDMSLQQRMLDANDEAREAEEIDYQISRTRDGGANYL